MNSKVFLFVGFIVNCVYPAPTNMHHYVVKTERGISEGYVCHRANRNISLVAIKTTNKSTGAITYMTEKYIPDNRGGSRTAHLSFNPEKTFKEYEQAFQKEEIFEPR